MEIGTRTSIKPATWIIHKIHSVRMKMQKMLEKLSILVSQNLCHITARRKDETNKWQSISINVTKSVCGSENFAGQ